MPDRQQTRRSTSEAITEINLSDTMTAVIVVDHGSRQAESNALVHEVVRQLRPLLPNCVVEGAHLELVEPSVASAVDRCVAQGASRIVACPYFLGPGQHGTRDLPAIVSSAVSRHEGVAHQVTPPLGLHPLIIQVILERIAPCFDS